jgi:hypothetical protein
MSVFASLGRALRGRVGSAASSRHPSHPKLSRATRPIVDQLEKRVLLTAVPSFVHMSGDASFTTSGTDGAMVIDLTAGSLTFDADLSSASGWNDAAIHVHNAARVYFNSAQALGELSLADSSRVSLASGGGEGGLAGDNLLQLHSLSIAPAPRSISPTMR